MTEIRLTSDNGVNKIENRSVELFPFQKTGVAFLLANQRGLLADDMGTGKTVQTLAAIRELHGEVINVLILSPASLMFMWDGSIRKQFSDFPLPEKFEDVGKQLVDAMVHTYQIVHLKNEKSSVQLKSRFRFILCSYNYIQQEKNVERLAKFRWSVIVADEAHALKNWGKTTYGSKGGKKVKRRGSLTTSGFKKILKNHKGRVWLLTGTPATDTGADYYTYLEVIQPGRWGSLSEFREMFCIKEQDYWSGHFKYKGVREDKKPLLRKAFSKIMLRRTKEQVVKDLPEKLISYIPVDIDASLIKESAFIREEFIRKVKADRLEMDSHVMRVIRTIGEAKVPTAVDYLLGLDAQVVTFCWNTSVVKEIGLALTKAGKTFGTITGDDTKDEKHENEVAFQEGKTQHILCNLQAGGTGRNLQNASYMLIVQPHYSPAVMEQAMARIIRIGQKAKCVNIVHLHAPGTVDDDIRNWLIEKSAFMRDVMGDRIWKR